MTTDLYRRGQPRDQLMDSWSWLILRTLRCKDAMVAKTSLKKSICALSVFIAIIPTDVLCQIWGKPPRVEFVGTNPVSKREIKFCCRLFTPSIKRLIRQFYDEVVQKRQRNVLKSVMLVPIFFPLLKLFFFLWQTNIPSVMSRNTTQNSLQRVSSMLADDLGTGQKVWGGGPEQRGGGSWGFEPCARGGSGNFQLPLGGGSLYFIT